MKPGGFVSKAHNHKRCGIQGSAVEDVTLDLIIELAVQ